MVGVRMSPQRKALGDEEFFGHTNKGPQLLFELGGKIVHEA